MTRETVIVAAIVLLAAPFAATMAGASADDHATWGLCQAQDNNDQGDEASNGTVGDTAPFANTSEEDCDNADHPADDNPGDDHVPDDPGGDAPDDDDNPGDDAPDGDDNPGDDGDDNADDTPDEDDNPGDDRP